MEHWENKRRFQRIALHLPIQYKKRGETQSFNAVCDNISSGGMGFVSPAFIPADSLVMLEIKILSRALRPIGRVTRISSIPHTQKSYLGIEFLELDPKEKDYLKEYMEMQTGN